MWVLLYDGYKYTSTLHMAHWEPMQRLPPIYPASEQEHHQGPLCVLI